MSNIEKKKPSLEIAAPEKEIGFPIESAGPLQIGANLFKNRTLSEGVPSGVKSGGASLLRGFLEGAPILARGTAMGGFSQAAAGEFLPAPDIPDPLADFKGFLKDVEDSNNYTAKHYEGESFPSLFKKFAETKSPDDFNRFVDYTVNRVSQQLPTLAALWGAASVGVPAPLALSILGTSAAGNQYSEDEDADLSEKDRMSRAFQSGLMEAGTEGLSFGLKGAAMAGKSALEAIPGIKPILARAIAKGGAGVFNKAAKAIGATPARRLISNTLINMFGEGSEEVVNEIGQIMSDEHYGVRMYSTQEKLYAAIEAFGIGSIATGVVGSPMIAAVELQDRRQAGNLPTPEELFTISTIIKVYKNGLPGSVNPENQIHIVDGDVIVLESLVDDMIQKQEWRDDQGSGTLEALGGEMLKAVQNERGSIRLPDIDPEKVQGIYQGVMNRMQSIEDTVKKAKKLGAEILPGEDPALRARSYLGIEQKVNTMLEDKTFHITRDGEIQISGEGLKPILEDYEKTSPIKNEKRRRQDLKDYLISKRIVEDLQRAKSEFDDDFIASPQQTADAKQKLAELQSSYGREFSVLENTANRLYSFQRRVLYNLVDSGNMSPEQFNKIVALNPHYASFERVLDEQENAGTPISRRRFTGAKSPIKRIKGSEREIHDPIESVIKNTYQIMDRAERNYVARGIANLADVLPDEIKPMDPRMVPVATEDFQVQVDPILKGKLTQVIKNLHGKFEQKFNIGGARLGYYVHPSNEIVTKIGSREDVLAHEVGHFLDMVYGLEEKLVNNPETNKELRIIADKRYEGAEVTEGYKKYVRKGSEKVAALVDAFITKPYLVDELAPKSGKVLKDLFEQHEELAPLRGARPGLAISTEKFSKTIFRPSPFVPKGNVIEYYDNGNRLFVEVSPNLYKAMTGLNETSLGLLTRILAVPAQWLRKGATLTPEFMARNPIRDQFTAFLNTNIGFIPFVDPAFALADILGKKQAYYDWMRSGGAYSGFVELNRKSLKKRLDKIMDKPDLLRSLNIIATAESLSQLFEQATRVGVYKAAVRKGLSPVEAGFQSREATTDFARRGSQTKEINAAVAFFNAGLQGVDKAFRAAAENPIGLTVKALATITLPSILLYMLNADDPDYEEIPRWQKNLFWLIKIPNTRTFIRIPKPFMYGQIFGTMPERFLDYMKTHNKEELLSLAKSLYDSVSPISGDPATGLLATAVKPFVEYGANWNFFRQRPVVPYWKAKLHPSEQYDSKTTETAKVIGRGLKFPPAHIENFTQGWFGGSGMYALQLSDQALRAAKRLSGEEVAPGKPLEIADIPLVKGFLTKPSGSPESVATFFKNFRRIETSHLTVMKMLRDGRAEEARLFAKKHGEGRYYKAARKISRALNRVDQRIEEVSKWQASDFEKRAELNKLNNFKIGIAKKANEIFKF